MKEYHKIETLYERDMAGTKRLIEGRFRDPLIKYIKDCKWVFTEKIDGTNIRIHWDGHKVEIGGRTDNAQIPAHLFSELSAIFLGNTNEEIFEQKFGENEVTLYGEGYGYKIQNGSSYSSKAEFALFDIEVGSTFLERSNVEAIAQAFNLKCVPIVLNGTIDEAVAFVRTKPTSLIATYGDTIMEGLVGTPLIRMRNFRGDRVIVKIKLVDFI